MTTSLSNVPGRNALAGVPVRVVRLYAKQNAAPGFPGFFAWLAASHPDLYNYVAVSLPNEVETEGVRSGGSQLGADAVTTGGATAADIAANASPDSSITSKIINTVSQAAAAFLPLIQQQQLLNVQLDRAKAGKPPLDTAQYESATAGVQVGINRSTQSTLLLIGGGLAGVWLLSRFMGRRR